MYIYIFLLHTVDAQTVNFVLFFFYFFSLLFHCLTSFLLYPLTPLPDLKWLTRFAIGHIIAFCIL